MTYSAALTEKLDKELQAHLVRIDGNEDLCFAVWFQSAGLTRTTALMFEALLPEPGERRVHGNASFLPNYVERAINVARERGGGLALLHSHPARGWQDMSRDDISAELRLAPTVLGATGFPLVGMTLGARDGTWSGRTWLRRGPRAYERVDFESIRVIGDRLHISFNPILRPAVPGGARLRRTVDTWGPDSQADISRTRIGVVGLGSVGGLVAEGLARTGLEQLVLIDYDSLEEVNLDRTIHGRLADIGRSKVAIAAERTVDSATHQAASIIPCEFSVCETEGFKQALGCDVLFSCVDRPWPRKILNVIAYAHLIPVIDGGIRAELTPSGRMRGADWRVHTVGPCRRCMLCHGQYEPWMVALDANGELDKPEYIETLAKNHVLRANQNVFAFSMNVASLELMHLIQMIAGPGGKFRSRAQRYNVKTGEMELPDTASIEEECKPGCIFPPLTARGDTATHPGTGRHPAAEQARGNRSFQGPSMAKSPGREASPGPTPNWSAKILEDARQWLSNRLSRQ